MKFSDVDRNVVISTVHRMKDEFRTTDLSQHPNMLRKHPAVRGERIYNSVVGRILGQLSDKNDSPVRMDDPPDDSGHLWGK